MIINAAIVRVTNAATVERSRHSAIAVASSREARALETLSDFSMQSAQATPRLVRKSFNWRTDMLVVLIAFSADPLAVGMLP